MLRFGDPEHIAMAKSRKRQTKMKFDNPPSKAAFEQKLCKECSKRVQKGTYNISSIFSGLCDVCKQDIVGKANKTFVIGGGVKIL